MTLVATLVCTYIGAFKLKWCFAGAVAVTIIAPLCWLSATVKSGAFMRPAVVVAAVVWQRSVSAKKMVLAAAIIPAVMFLTRSRMRVAYQKWGVDRNRIFRAEKPDMPSANGGLSF